MSDSDVTQMGELMAREQQPEDVMEAELPASERDVILSSLRRVLLPLHSEVTTQPATWPTAGLWGDRGTLHQPFAERWLKYFS